MIPTVAAGEHNLQQTESPIMQCYPESVSIRAGELLQLGVEPPTRLGLSRQFKLAIFRQGALGSLDLLDLPIVERIRFATHQGAIFSVAPLLGQRTPDIDWRWPRISLRIPDSWPSGVYFVAVYTVDRQGNPDTDVGRDIEKGYSVYPTEPWSQALALVVVKPAITAPKNKIAYILAVSTYHAYNYTGEGCYYYKNQVLTLTLRRPGGGVSVLTPSDKPEADYYDKTSYHNTFAHWDAKFIQWLTLQDIHCDFYATTDIVGSSPILLSDTNQPAYPLALFVGHDEYWDQTIRTNLQTYQTNGGNIAIFSGNTCYRPVSFSDMTTSVTMMTRLNEEWENPPQDQPDVLIGVQYRNGGASYGYVNDDPKNAERQRYAVGMKIVDEQAARHWVFTGTELKKDDVIGQGNDADDGTKGDHLLGYECDGLSYGIPIMGFQLLAMGVIPQPWFPPPWDYYVWNDVQNEIKTPSLSGGRGCMVITATDKKTGVLFNAATTDWARVLTCDRTKYKDAELVHQITLNVLKELGALVEPA